MRCLFEADWKLYAEMRKGIAEVRKERPLSA
jgi:hypothetical protein